MQAFHPEQAEVHQVPLTPAPVTRQFVDQVGRHFLVAARQVVGDPHAPSGATHQCRFDEIVGQDLAGERAPARQAAERAVADEWRDADDRVVAPVVGFAELPEMQAGREQRPVDGGGELLDARIERVATGSARRRLDDSRIGIGLGDPDQRRQAVAAHHAVGIEHDHVTVLASPAAAEIGDVAALALDAVLAPAIEDAPEAAHCAVERRPGVDLRDADVGIAAVGEHEEIEAIECAGVAQRFVRGAQSRENAHDILVADRHDDRGARVLGNRRRAVAAGSLRDRETVAPRREKHEPGDRGPESGRNPAEEDREQHEHRDLERLPPVVGQHPRHEVGRDDRLADDQCQQQQASPRRAPVPAYRGSGLRCGDLGRAGILGQRCPRAVRGPGARRHRAARQGRRRVQALAALDVARHQRPGGRVWVPVRQPDARTDGRVCRVCRRGGGAGAGELRVHVGQRVADRVPGLERVCLDGGTPPGCQRQSREIALQRAGDGLCRAHGSARGRPQLPGRM